MNKGFTILFFFLFLFSCDQEGIQHRTSSFAPRIVKSKGHIVTDLRLKQPEIVKAGNPTVVPAGKPFKVQTNTNIYPVGPLKKVSAGIPKVVSPGIGAFPMPIKMPAINSPFATGIPEVEIANESGSKDLNTQNFSSVGKSQGLRHGYVNCVFEDRNGNLWFGTDGGGATKYDGYSFTYFTVKEGLSNNEVNTIMQDWDGTLWFGTDNGVTKYDGKSFTHFTVKEGLSDNFVECILQDKRGDLWFGTFGGGVSQFDGKTFTHYTVREGLPANLVACILQDKSGDLWFGTIGGGACKFDGKSFTCFSRKEGLSNDSVAFIMQDKSGNLWFGTDSGATKYDGKSFTYFTAKDGLSNNRVESIFEDKSGNIWFATDGGGISKLDGRFFTHYSVEQGLSNDFVEGILRDRSGNLWFATNGGGVAKYGGNSFTHFKMNKGISNNGVSSILQDKNGNLWFGTRGGGVSKYDGNFFSNFTIREGLSNDNVISILEDRIGNLWFGTYGGGVSKYDGKSISRFTVREGLSNNIVFSMLQDKNGNIWFGTNGGGVSKYDGKSFIHFTERQGLSSNIVFSILEDRNGNLWFGTNGGGVSKYDGKSFIHFTEKDGLPNNSVYSILEDNSGNLWFGTAAGVSKYDGNFFTNITEREGLANNFVESILQDKKGNLWFGTRNGLSRLSRKNLERISDSSRLRQMKEGDILFKNFTYEDGFLGIGCSPRAIYEDKNGTIWIGADDRLSAFHPEAETADSIAPNIQLSAIELFNERIGWKNLEKKKDSSFILGNGVKVNHFEFDGLTKWYGLPENLSLKYNNNYLTFDFIGITQKSPKKVKYQYKLEDNDENWSAISNSSKAIYGNLAPGVYTFIVKAMNSEGIWSPEIHYKFTIRPPWWRTWLAYAMYFLIIIFCITYYVKWRERALKERQKVLEKTVRKRTAELVDEKEKVELQKERSEELLLNILPSAVAEELKLKGSAEAKQFDQVTVMFTDFKEFTQISEKLSPAELVAEIHECFKAFDHIISRNHVEKIKTMGDSYMCAGGLPLANITNPIDVVSAALEILQFMEQHLEKKLKDGKKHFETRIGIHTGPVVAGIVGINKFAYDIWGDTVNIASRMESSGEAGKINISGSTYELVKDKFSCIHRGKIQAKNKGMIDMYFVESLA